MKRYVDDWKTIREALKDPQALSPEERRELLSLVEYDIGVAKAEPAPATSADPETPAVAPTKSKPMTLPDRRRAAAGRARALGHLDLAKKIERARYVKDIENAVDEMDRREAMTEASA